MTDMSDGMVEKVARNLCEQAGVNPKTLVMFVDDETGEAGTAIPAWHYFVDRAIPMTEALTGRAYR